jgi:hypothetical protein
MKYIFIELAAELALTYLQVADYLKHLIEIKYNCCIMVRAPLPM